MLWEFFLTSYEKELNNLKSFTYSRNRSIKNILHSFHVIGCSDSAFTPAEPRLLVSRIQAVAIWCLLHRTTGFFLNHIISLWQMHNAVHFLKYSRNTLSSFYKLIGIFFPSRLAYHVLKTELLASRARVEYNSRVIKWEAN